MSLRWSGHQAGALISLLLGAGMVGIGVVVFVRAFLPGAGLAAMGVLIGPTIAIPGLAGVLFAWRAWSGDTAGRVGSILFCAALGVVMVYTLANTIRSADPAARLAGCENQPGKGAEAVANCQAAVSDMANLGPGILDIAVPMAVGLLCLVAVGLLLLRWNAQLDTSA